MKCPALIRLVSVAALFTPLAASADVIPMLNGLSAAGPAFAWAYNLELAADQDIRDAAQPVGPSPSSQGLNHGAFFTSFGFAGYVAGACSSTSAWACRAQTLAFTPTSFPPVVDAALGNPGINGQPSVAGLTQFSGPRDGKLATNVDQMPAPVARLLPEPGSLALASVALLLLGGGLRRRRNAA